jgi:hypothetical protein
MFLDVAFISAKTDLVTNDNAIPRFQFYLQFAEYFNNFVTNFVVVDYWQNRLISKFKQDARNLPDDLESLLKSGCLKIHSFKNVMKHIKVK